MEKKVLWLVTARSGSKSIPNKNVNLLGGYPLLAYRIKSASKSSHSNDVWISTDSEDYAEIAKKFGAQIPFIRPVELATDNASSNDVVLHAMKAAELMGKKYQFIGLLEPTSPFITTNQLDDAITKLQYENKAHSVVAVRESRPNKIFIQNDSKFIDALSRRLKKLSKFGRQSFNTEITPSGGFYISNWDKFLKNKTFYNSFTLSYKVDDIAGLEIDESVDWLFANFIIEKNIFNLNNLFSDND